ncbi:MAG: ABC transporter ATP-binding protein [SAR324 cluster bacterium]|nr:ABC transporter ATP-binding protein [SAR324 cluster bacterium]
MRSTSNTSNTNKTDTQYSAIQVFIRLSRYVMKYKFSLILGIGAMLIFATATSISPWALKVIVDAADAQEKYTLWQYFWVGGVLLLLIAVRGVVYYWQNYIMSMLGQSLNRDLRSEMFRKIAHLSFGFFNHQRVGDLMGRFTIDISVIEQAFIMAITGPVRDVAQIILLMGYLWSVNFKMFLLSVTLLVPVSYLINYFSRMNKKASDVRQEKFGLLAAITNEAISGVRLVKAFNMEAYEIRKFNKENNNVLRYFLKTIKISSLSTPLLEFVAAIYLIFIFIYGAFLINTGEITGGGFFSFLMAFFMVIGPLKKFNGFSLKMQEAASAAGRIFTILDYPDDINQEKKKPSLPQLKDKISIKINTFSYSKKTVLRDIDITIKKSEMVAIVGLSGSGKTTLINLLPRFFELDSGQGMIKFDENNINKYYVGSLRRQIAIVSQETPLFNGTVRYNISYGKTNSSMEEIISASKKALAHEFIESFENGYDQQIGERGMSISGGQRQRIAIARAILRDAPILILDEATNALDTQSEKKVNAALENLMKDRTTIIVAHKLSTIRRVNRIFVMKDGTVEEQGDFDSLLKKSGEFRGLYDASYSGATYLKDDERAKEQD